jgi:pimeloyl-ACP methyl ester carboxylesterase
MFYEVNPGKARAIVVYHGNAGRACDRTYLSDEFTNLNYTTMLVEYPGYAGIDGKPSMKAMLKGVRDMDAYAKKQGYKEIMVLGESIGTGPASYHAKIGKPEKLILVAPFTRLSDAIPAMFKIFPVKLLLRDNYDNKGWLGGYKGKVLIIHGLKDSIVPARLSENLFPKAKRMLVDAGHNDVYTDKALSAMRNFLT